MDATWYAKPNDLIGGWCVMDVDQTPAVANRPEVADFTSKALAEHIADLHNKWLAGRAMLDAQRARPGVLAILAGLGGKGDLRFETTPDGEHYKKVTHIATGKTGYGNSEIDAMMNLAETWDVQSG